MRQPKPIPGRISPGAREKLSKVLESAGFRDAVLCLLKARISDDKGNIDDGAEEKWIAGTYGPENIRSLERDWSSMGHHLLCELDGMILAIPQFHKLDEIIGKEMIWQERKLMFREYPA